MLTQLLHVFGASLAVFLVGANAAFLVNLGHNLANWFVLKIIAIDGLMIYMAMSLFVGNVGWGRATFGVLVLMLDVVALAAMWLSIEKLRSEGVVGFIPIAKLTGLHNGDT